MPKASDLFRVGGSVPTTAQEIAITPDASIDLEADDVAEAIKELAADVHDLRTPPADISSAITAINNGINS